MYRASKNAQIESILLIMFGVSISIFPLLSGKRLGIETILTSLLVVILGIYMFIRVKRIRVNIYSDRIEYFGESNKSDRVVYFNNIYLVETVNKSGAQLTFIVDKYKEGNRWIIRGTVPKATEKEMGRDKDIKLDFKQSLCIDSRKIENAKEIVEVICSRIQNSRVGEGTERYIKNISLKKEEQPIESKKLSIMYKVVMSVNLLGLLIIIMLLEGKSPILTKSYFKITSLIVYLLNGGYSVYLLRRFKEIHAVKTASIIGLIISLSVLAMTFL